MKGQIIMVLSVIVVSISKQISVPLVSHAFKGLENDSIVQKRIVF